MPTVFYIGDSTVTFNKVNTYPQQGMSNILPLFLREDYHAAPHGYNGRSTKSFLDEGLWKPVENAMSPGDFLLIQFSHNDEKNDPARHTDPDTTFKDNLRCFIRIALEKGAYPILHTPIARRLFNEQGDFLPGSHGEYPRAIREVGAEMAVPVIDLTALTEKFLADTGDACSRPLFVWPTDNTHLKFEGAMKMMRFWAQEMVMLGSPYSDLIVPLTDSFDRRGEI